MSDLQDRVCLVTGGTAGIGLETARLLARDGADVIIVGRDAEKGEAALIALGDAAKVRFIQADLADLASIGSLVDRAGPSTVSSTPTCGARTSSSRRSAGTCWSAAAAAS